MRTDDALNLFASSLALVLFALGMAKFAEPRAIFFGYADFPASHGAHLSLANPASATEEFDVCKAGRNDPIEAALTEPMLSWTLLECASPPILGVGDRRRQCERGRCYGGRDEYAILDHSVVSRSWLRVLSASDGLLDTILVNRDRGRAVTSI
jgi:hypothetical protein